MKSSHNNPTLFLITFITLFLFQYVFDVKSYIVTILCYGVLIFFLLKQSISSTLFLLLLATVSFEKGIRDWMITIVPHGIEPWMSEYSMYFGLTLKLIFSTALFFIILAEKNRQTLSVPIPLVLFVFFSTISTISASDTNIAFIGYIRLVLGACLYILGNYMFNSSQKKQSAIAVLFAIFLFFGFIGTKQQLSLQPLGLFLEDNASLRKLGYLTTDGDPIYRVSGFTGHPTFFASFLSLLFPLGSGVLLWTYKHKHSKLLWISFASMILSGVAILSTQSRSGWVSISISTVYFLVLLIRAQEKRAIKFFLIGIAILLVTTITTTPTIINRLASIPNVFITGSGNVRILLIQQAFEMIYEHPFLGVGLNHFVRVMKSHDLPINLQGFMFPVHNTFLLFFSELGIPAGLAFLWFTISVMKQSMHRASKNWVTLGVWLGALTFFINAQFHTLFNQDPTFDVFMILLGFLSVI